MKNKLNKIFTKLKKIIKIRKKAKNRFKRNLKKSI